MNRDKGASLVAEAWVKAMRLKFDGASEGDVEHARRNARMMEDAFKRRFGDGQ